MKKIIIFILCIYPTVAFAGPPQIDILGIVPGVSTKEDVLGISSKKVGGLLAVCGVRKEGYTAGKVAHFLCSWNDTFEKTSDGNILIYDNIETYNIVLEGFSRKFGPPDKIEDIPVKTKLGVEYISQHATWIDEKGNILILKSRHGKVDEGWLDMFSADKVRELNKQNVERDQSREF